MHTVHLCFNIPLQAHWSRENSELVSKIQESLSWERLGHGICKLVFKGRKLNAQSMLHNTFSDKMIVDFYMLSTSVHNRIGSKVGGTNIVA